MMDQFTILAGDSLRVTIGTNRRVTTDLGRLGRRWTGGPSRHRIRAEANKTSPVLVVHQRTTKPVRNSVWDGGADAEVIRVFEQLLKAASLYKKRTGRYLQICGELGELYAEIKFGLKRHRPGAAGSDGRLGNDFVEVKTISPEKTKDKEIVKLSGHSILSRDSGILKQGSTVLDHDDNRCKDFLIRNAKLFACFVSSAALIHES